MILDKSLKNCYFNDTSMDKSSKKELKDAIYRQEVYIIKGAYKKIYL